jgi:hypothetical protein
LGADLAADILNSVTTVFEFTFQSIENQTTWATNFILDQKVPNRGVQNKHISRFKKPVVGCFTQLFLINNLFSVLNKCSNNRLIRQKLEKQPSSQSVKKEKK